MMVDAASFSSHQYQQFVQSTSATLFRKQHKLMHKINIQNFATYESKLNHYWRSSFIPIGEAALRFSLTCLMKKEASWPEEKLVLIVKFESNSKCGFCEPLWSIITIQILKPDGTKKLCIRKEGQLRCCAQVPSPDQGLLARQELLNPVNGLISIDGTLTLLLEIVIFRDQTIVPDVPTDKLARLITACHSKVRADHLDYAKRPTTGDVILKATFKSDTKEFRANKSMLCSRSRVFAVMFGNESPSNAPSAGRPYLQNGENLTGQVVIEDIHPEVLDKLLDYIYSGEPCVDLPHDQAAKAAVYELIYAADKYELEDLVAVCAERLRLTLSVDSVAEIVLLADMHSLVGLKRAAIDYICTNAQVVRNTQGWTALVDSNSWPTLASALLDALAMRKASSNVTISTPSHEIDKKDGGWW